MIEQPTFSRRDGAARVRSENPITLEEAQALFRDPPSMRTMLRWIVAGKAGVRLDTAKIRGEVMTSAAAVLRFRDATGV